MPSFYFIFLFQFICIFHNARKNNTFILEKKKKKKNYIKKKKKKINKWIKWYSTNQQIKCKICKWIYLVQM